MKSLAFCTDNIRFMRRLPDKAYHLANPDPPYGIRESSANHKSRNTPIKQRNGTVMYTKQADYGIKNWDDNPPSDEYFFHLFRVSINQAIWGANYFKQIVGGVAFKPPRRAQYDDFIRKYPTGWVIWDKVNGGSDFNDCELMWTSFDRPTYIVYYMWNGMMQGKSIKEGYIAQGNKKLNEKRFHPTQKPLALYQHTYTEYVKPGQSVFDPNMGSGGSRIACYKMGIHYTGCEIDRDIFNSQEKRFKELTYEPLNFSYGSY